MSGGHGQADRLHEQMLAVAALVLAAVIAGVAALGVAAQARAAVGPDVAAAVRVQVRAELVRLGCHLGGQQGGQVLISCTPR